MRDHVTAKALLDRALKILERSLGLNHPDLTPTLDNLATLLADMGQYTEAKLLLERALQIREQTLGPTHRDVAPSLSSLADFLHKAGNHTRARTLYERALKIREQALGPNHPDVAVSLNDLALLLQDTGAHGEARPLFQRALKIREQALGPTHPTVAASLNSLGRLLRETGDYSAAGSLHEQALQVQERVLSPSHPDLARTLSRLALALQGAGDYAAALSLHERALAIRMRTHGPDHLSVATSLSELALLHQTTGDYVTARSLNERALAIREKALGPNHRDVAESLNNLANLLRLSGDHERARPLLERALQISEGTWGPEHRNTGLILGNLAAVEWTSGNLQQAVIKLGRAVTIVQNDMRRIMVGLSTREKYGFLESMTPLIGFLFSLPSEMVPDALSYRAQLEWKNLAFRLLVEERFLTEAIQDSHIKALAQDYGNVRRGLANLSVKAPESRDLVQYRAEFSTLTQQLEVLERDLSRLSIAFRQHQRAATAGPGEICSALEPDAALVDLSIYGRDPRPPVIGAPSASSLHYVAFVLRGGACELPVRVDLGPAAPIDEDVRRFRDAINRDTPDPGARELRARYRKTLAARLYAKLFPRALQQAIAGKSRLIISPDGTLALLPFSLLPGEDGHEFLL